MEHQSGVFLTANLVTTSYINRRSHQSKPSRGPTNAPNLAAGSLP